MIFRQKVLTLQAKILYMNNYGTILIVDDNPAILTALRLCLDTTFEHIVTLERPDDILKTLAQEAVDLILLDMNFTLGVNSGQEGLLWLRTIRKHHPQLPVVLLTAYADIALAVRGLKSGAADFITKPWDNDELVRKLKDVLDMQGEIRNKARPALAGDRRAASLTGDDASEGIQVDGERIGASGYTERHIDVLAERIQGNRLAQRR